MGRIPQKRDRLPTPNFLGFPNGSYSKESASSMGDLDSIPGLRRSPRGGCGNPLQYSCLENPHGQRKLAGYSPLDLTDSDTTEGLSTTQQVRTDHQCTQNNLKIRQVCREMLLQALPASHIFTVRMHTST